VATGQRIFANTCAMCHGSDARGAKGYPNLTDRHWQWGSSPNDILATILDGRQANMPPFATALGDPSNVTATAVHVQKLGGMNVDPQLDRIGAASFSGICAACHGPDGKGNPAIGSADFTDEYWLYGNRVEDIVAAIEKGHDGHMPAHRQILGETRARLVGAYVWSLSHPSSGGAAGVATSGAAR
jgi:cytochrome c oxidase cbb3-type subunit 3